MCDTLPGDRCAADTGGRCADKVNGYQEAHPDGPALDPLAQRTLISGFAGPLPVKVHVKDVGNVFDWHKVYEEGDGSAKLYASLSLDLADLTPESVPRQRRMRWLVQNHGELAGFFSDTYRAGLTMGSKSEGQLHFTAPVSPGTSEVEVPARVHRLAQDLKSQGARPLAAQFATWQANRQTTIDETVDGFYEAFMGDESIRDDEGDDVRLRDGFQVANLTDEVKARIERDARRFTLESRELIAAAQAAAAREGRELTFYDVGRAYLRSRNGHPGGLSEVALGWAGDELHRRACLDGPLRVTHDGYGHLNLDEEATTRSHVA